MALDNIQASSVSFSFQYSSLQLSSASQPDSLPPGNVLPPDEHHGQNGPHEGHGGFRGLMQSVQMTFSQLGFNLSAQPEGAANDANTNSANDPSTAQSLVTGSPTDSIGKDVMEALHRFIHSLAHALKSMEVNGDGQNRGEHEEHGDRGDHSRNGSSVMASYSSFSLSLSLLVSNLDAGSTSPVSNTSNPALTDTQSINPDSPSDPSSALPGLEYPASSSVMPTIGNSQNKALSRLQDAFKNLLETLNENSASGTETSLKDFLQGLQGNVGSHSQQQQYSFSMTVTTGSIIYTQA